MTVIGESGLIPYKDSLPLKLFCGNSGTSIRFLTALCALGHGEFRLDGVKRMRQRPQQDLLDALTDFGTELHAEQGDGCPPLHLKANGLNGGPTQIAADASTQFVSALLMVSPYTASGATISLRGRPRPHYIEITRRMMSQWGVETEQTENGAYHVKSGQTYLAQPTYLIEPDASSASYFFAAAALTGGQITVSGLGADAMQGDVRFATEVLAEMGCTVTESEAGLTVQGVPIGELRGITRDMSAISDTALTLAALAPFANSPTTVTGIAHSRKQECDRVSAVCTELRRLGVTVEEFEDGYKIYPLAPGQKMTPATIETYHDHRVAMSFALIGLREPGVTIHNPACVAKTFPDYWQRLKMLRG